MFFSIVGFIIVLLVRKEDKYAMHYGKQGLILFFAWIVAWIASFIFAFVPVFGWLLSLLMWIGLLILWVMGIIYAFSGEEKYLPVIGKFADVIKL